MEMLRSVSAARISSLRHQVEFFWRTYFSSLRAITLTTLQIINDRVYPYTALKYEDWNDPPTSVSDLWNDPPNSVSDLFVSGMTLLAV